MKRKFLAVAIVLCMTLVLAMTACTPTYTLTLYDQDGKTVLGTVEAKEGSAPVKPADPKKDGFVFDGWYVTPTSTKPYDFTAPLTEDAAAYAHWKTEGYEDSRNWVIVGSGIGWTAEEAISFQKVEGSGNVFEVTVDVNLGDELKCTVLNPDGVLDYNNPDGANVGFDLLTDPDGNFDEGSGLGDAPKNIICANAGNYTFTLTTDPVNSNNSLSAVRNGDVVGGNEPTGVVMTYYIKGDKITNWKDFINAGTTLKETTTEGVYTIAVYMVEGDSFMFASLQTEDGVTTAGTVYIKYVNLDEDSKALFEDSGGNMITKAAGMYSFTYNVETAVLSATVDTTYTPEPADYYIDGTFVEGMSWEGYCFNEDYKLVQDAENPHVYTLEHVHLPEGSELIIQAFKEGATERGEWGTDTYTGLGNYPYANLFNGGENFSAVSATNNNIKVLKTSDYKITFNSHSKMITIEDENIPDDAYVYGTMTGAGWAVDPAWKMTYDADAKTYTLTKEFTEGDRFGIRICVGNTTDQRSWANASNVSGSPAGFDISGSDISCTVTGTYTVVVDMSGETPVVTITAATAAE